MEGGSEKVCQWEYGMTRQCVCVYALHECNNPTQPKPARVFCDPHDNPRSHTHSGNSWGTPKLGHSQTHINTHIYALCDMASRHIVFETSSNRQLPPTHALAVEANISIEYCWCYFMSCNIKGAISAKQGWDKHGICIRITQCIEPSLSHSATVS